jgi:filamentous hemagglutinin
MNKQHYRIVFNECRNQWMAVAETVAARGKGGGAGWAGGFLPAGLSACLRAPSLAVLLLLGLVWVEASQAQIVGDQAAPGAQRPTVLNAANGVPLVNIQTPSAAGVSRNAYSQFDVGASGAILNNARAQAQTELGGWVQGNPWLAKGPARVIVNEVGSQAASQLRGYVEVAGQRADVIIANPSGIVVDGAGFINAAGVTLTTGRPQYGEGGALSGYRIQDGNIEIAGVGLDASRADYTRILARAAQISGGVWAKDLKVLTGAGEASADGARFAPGDEAQGKRPAVAIDVAALGGMYAGKIHLVATEAGVGVNNAGIINADAGALTLSADGSLSNSGTIAASAAGQELSVGVRGLDNSGTLSSLADMRLSDSGAASGNRGQINAGGQFIAGVQTLHNQATGSVTAQGLQINAKSLQNDGKITQTGAQELAIRAASLSNVGAQAHIGMVLPDTTAGGAAGGASVGVPSPGQALPAGRIQVEQGIDNSGQIAANGPTDLTLEQGARNSGTLAVRALDAGARFDNSGGHAQVQSFSGAAESFVNRAGSFHGSADLSLDTGQLDNSGGQIGSGGRLGIAARQSLSNAGGTLLAVGDLEASAPEMDNAGGHIVSDSGGVQLDVAGSLNNPGGDIRGAAVTLAAGGIDNSRGKIQGDGALSATAASLNNAGGLIAASGELSVQAQSLNNGQGGLIASSAGLSVRGGDIGNAGGSLTGGQVDVEAASLDNRQGGIAQSGQGVMRVAVGGQLANGQGGAIQSNGALNLAAGALDNQGGAIASAGKLTLDAPQFNNQGGAIETGGALVIDSAQALDNSRARLQAGGPIRLSSPSLNNDQGVIGSASGIDAATGALSNAGGAIIADGALTLGTQALNNQGGQLGGASVAIDTHGQRLNNAGGKSSPRMRWLSTAASLPTCKACCKPVVNCARTASTWTTAAARSWPRAASA